MIINKLVKGIKSIMTIQKAIRKSLFRKNIKKRIVLKHYTRAK